MIRPSIAGTFSDELTKLTYSWDSTRLISPLSTWISQTDFSSPSSDVPWATGFPRLSIIKY